MLTCLENDKKLHLILQYIERLNIKNYVNFFIQEKFDTVFCKSTSHPDRKTKH